MIDLHAHTTASDGTDSPRELIESAAAAGVRTLAITDHDTTAGWAEAAEAVQQLDVPFSLLRATEFSCVYRSEGGERVALHLLGYLFDPEAAELKAERARLRESRFGRGERIVGNLERAGFPINWRQVVAIADGGSVGRPHIARALVQAGVVGSVNEAFSELLASSSPYYVRKDDMAVVPAIGLIRAAGGVPVIAHPWGRGRGQILTEGILAELVEAGLLGIEVDHLDHTADDRSRLRQIARHLGVIATGSSDYHGANKTVRLGAETTDPEALQVLLELASGIELIQSSGR